MSKNGMPFFKMYTDARRDAKLESLDDLQFRTWFKLLCYAAEQPFPTRGEIHTTAHILAVEVTGGDLDRLYSTLEALAVLGIVHYSPRVTPCHESGHAMSRVVTRSQHLEAEEIASCHALSRVGHDSVTSGHEELIVSFVHFVERQGCGPKRYPSDCPEATRARKAKSRAAKASANSSGINNRHCVPNPSSNVVGNHDVAPGTNADGNNVTSGVTSAVTSMSRVVTSRHELGHECHESHPSGTNGLATMSRVVTTVTRGEEEEEEEEEKENTLFFRFAAAAAGASDAGAGAYASERAGTPAPACTCEGDSPKTFVEPPSGIQQQQQQQTSNYDLSHSNGDAIEDWCRRLLGDSFDLHNFGPALRAWRDAYTEDRIRQYIAKAVALGRATPAYVHGCLSRPDRNPPALDATASGVPPSRGRLRREALVNGFKETMAAIRNKESTNGTG